MVPRIALREMIDCSRVGGKVIIFGHFPVSRNPFHHRSWRCVGVISKHTEGIKQESPLPLTPEQLGHEIIRREPGP